LRENESLETLSVIIKDISFEDYLEFVAAIQPNTTLKSLTLHAEIFCVSQEQTENLFAALKENYGLETIPRVRKKVCHRMGNVRSIFQLNRAGRRYLVQDGSSISKGVHVLSGVSNDINSVFLHLLENPRLCDRNAVEIPSIDNVDNAMASSPGNSDNAGSSSPVNDSGESGGEK
jgi:hypothetical protein